MHTRELKYLLDLLGYLLSYERDRAGTGLGYAGHSVVHIVHILCGSDPDIKYLPDLALTV